TGNVRLAGPVTVTDDKATVTCPNTNTVGNLDGFLDPGEKTNRTASCSITYTHLNNRTATNTATAHAATTDSTTASKTVTAAQNTTLSLVYSASPSTDSRDVHSIPTRRSSDLTGNVRLAGPVTVTDDKATVTCPNTNTVGNLDGF